MKDKRELFSDEDCTVCRVCPCLGLGPGHGHGPGKCRAVADARSYRHCHRCSHGTGVGTGTGTGIGSYVSKPDVGKPCTGARARARNEGNSADAGPLRPGARQRAARDS